MAKVVAIYKTPKDMAAFDKHYASIHIPLAKKIPGLRKLETSTGGIYSPGGASPYYLIVTLYFDTLAEVQAAFASPEGQAAAGDLANFADGGVELVFFDTKDV